MVMKFTPGSWLIEILMFSGFFLAIAFAACLFIVSIDSSYIGDQYKENWNMNYIVDINVQPIACERGYEEKILGVWSGLPNTGCVCTSGLSGLQQAFDTNEDCKKFQMETQAICKSLTEKDPINLKYYRNKKICVKRSNANFATLFNYYEQSVQNKFTNLSKTSFMNNINFFEFLSEKAFYLSSTDKVENFIDPNALIDLKIVNINLFPIKYIKATYGYDLSRENGYNEIEIEKDIYLFYKRIGTFNKILDVHNIIVDIHLSNELWCSFLDISPPKSLYYTNYMNFGGFEFCNKMNYKESKLTINDDYKRFERVNFEFDNSLSKLDFYKSNGITEFYTQNKIKYNNIDHNTPSLVFEKYLYGIGCPQMDSIENHINIMNSGFILRNLSKAYLLFTIVTLVFSFLFIICRLCANCSKYPKLYWFIVFLIILVTLINLFLILTYVAIVRNVQNYLVNFTTKCQIDYSNSQYLNFKNIKTTPNELRYWNDLSSPYQIGGFCLFIELALTVLILLYLFVTCRHKEKSQKVLASEVVIYENKPSVENNYNTEPAHQAVTQRDYSDRKTDKL